MTPFLPTPLATASSMHPTRYLTCPVFIFTKRHLGSFSTCHVRYLVQLASIKAKHGLLLTAMTRSTASFDAADELLRTSSVVSQYASVCYYSERAADEL